MSSCPNITQEHHIEIPDVQQPLVYLIKVNVHCPYGSRILMEAKYTERAISFAFCSPATLSLSIFTVTLNFIALFNYSGQNHRSPTCPLGAIKKAKNRNARFSTAQYS
ncbi:hypothetical protein NPIL_237711 [Nephila pilipes]|uniref:Uncharacterized protein n=1 Tax=Nephila pilipes TaxID=299642 RepID=A0A8X6TI28_NEPPI|nr:hypothetical protein NPIL_237711 [Nephila pilipes]